MTLLPFVFLLALLPAGSARGRYLPKAAISSPVFGPRQVQGVLGGSATVKCFYPPTAVNKHDRKYWCRQRGPRCDTVVSSAYVDPSYRGRVSLTDHPEAEHFQVNISALEPGDAGTFQCGVGVNSRGLSHTVTLSITEAPGEAAELFYVKLRSTWTVSCNFGEDTASIRRYLCKKEKEGCQNIVDSHKNINPDFKGRVLMAFEEPPGTFRVTMTHMDWEDTGLYYCGAGEYGKDNKTLKGLDVFVYEDKNFPQLKTTVTGKNGSSATFECLYDPLKKSSTRLWGKWREKGGYDTIIDNTGNVNPNYEGRVAMFENPENRTVTVILTQLQAKDEGFYWCISSDLKEQQSSTELKVVKGEPALKGDKKVEAPAGSRVDLTCSYPCQYYSYEKYWCKWNYSGCPELPAREQGLPGPAASCNASSRTVVLSFHTVTEGDEGWYWCGVKRNGAFGEALTVQLVVDEDNTREHSPALLEVDPSRESGAVPPGGARGDAEVRKGAVPESSDESRGSNTLALVLGPLAGLILIVVTAFAIVKYRQLKRSDLVSVGSYRTNISMSDFESVKDHGASNNAKGIQETPVGGDEFITTTDTPESAADTTKAKRSSKEDAELAYSSFLATSDSIAQGSRGGDSAGPDASQPQLW
ncbi:PIGR protein, partial [Locustella ochotensis]|nr:PIGR protein [Locustella ochotensis]